MSRRNRRVSDLLLFAALGLSVGACDSLVGESFSGYHPATDAGTEVGALLDAAGEPEIDGGHTAAAEAGLDAEAGSDVAPQVDAGVDDGRDTGVDRGDGWGSDASGTPDSAVNALFPFRPSNIAIEQLRLPSIAPQLGDAVLDDNGCEIDSFQTPKTIMCMVAPSFVGPLEGVQWMALRVGEGPPLDVFIARSWVITNRAMLRIPNRTVLVALGDIVIAGEIRADFADASEPGEGGGGDSTAGAIGGSFCGHGGVGSHSMLAPSPTYGTPELVPPRVGSAGGPGPWSTSAGGFLHLLAGGKVTLTSSGRISAAGGGGSAAGGGGSGGAILIEATSAAIHGIIAANGGGGGGALSYAPGQSGGESAIAATGGLDSSSAIIGGAGGAGTSADGQNAVATAPSAGGGGGVGRIRINVNGQQLTVDGILSPDPSTGCATQGAVQGL